MGLPGAAGQLLHDDLTAAGQFELAATMPRIVDFVQRQWATIYLQEFTDHGPRHSERVAEFAMGLIGSTDIPERYRLHVVERYVLWSSAWLHDIGMQVLGSQRVGELTPSAHTRIRRDHAPQSAETIRNEWCAIGLLQDSMLTETIALVAGAHGTSFYREACDQLYSIKKVRNVDLRGALLAATLLISDEMDLDNTRVPSLPAGAKRTPISAAHILKHQLVVSSGFVHGAGGQIRLQVCFQQPSGVEPVEQQMMERWVLEKLREQIALIEADFAKGLNLYAQVSRDIEVTRQPGGRLEGLTAQGRHLVEADLARYDLINHDKTLISIEEKTGQLAPVMITGRLKASLGTGNPTGTGYVDVDGREDLLRAFAARRRAAGTTVLSSWCLYETLGASSLADVLTELLLSLGGEISQESDRDPDGIARAIAAVLKDDSSEAVLIISSVDLLPTPSRDWIRTGLVNPLQQDLGVAFAFTCGPTPPSDVKDWEIVASWGLEREGVTKFLARYVEPGVAESEAASDLQYAKYQELRQNHLLPPLGGVRF